MQSFFTYYLGWCGVRRQARQMLRRACWVARLWRGITVCSHPSAAGSESSEASKALWERLEDAALAEDDSASVSWLGLGLAVRFRVTVGLGLW